MAGEEKYKFKVYVLGQFTIEYDGQRRVPGTSLGARFLQLLQMVWLSGEEGIKKQDLVSALYNSENEININNSFNNLIYQLRKQMVKADFPRLDYVVKKRGIYKCDPLIDLDIDVLDFKNEIGISFSTPDTSKEWKAASIEDCLAMYRGTLLPAIQTQNWVIMETVELRRMYSKAVNWLCDYYKTEKQYRKLYEVSTKAAEIYPEEDWFAYQIEALVKMNEQKEALKLYDRVVEFFNSELGIPVPKKLVKAYSSISSDIDIHSDRIGEIKKEISDHGSDSDKNDKRAYECSYPGFIDAYNVLERNMERTGSSVYMMLLTAADYEGKPIHGDEKIKQRSAQLLDAISGALRSGDTFTRYSKTQFLVLLIGTSEDDCEVIFDRIKKKLESVAGQRANLKYSVVSLSDLAGNMS